MEPVAGNHLIEGSPTRHRLIGSGQSRRDRRQGCEQQLDVIDEVRRVLFVGDFALQRDSGRGDLGVEAHTPELDVFRIGDEVPRRRGIGIRAGSLSRLRCQGIHLGADTRRHSERLIDDPCGSRSRHGCGSGPLDRTGDGVHRRQPAVIVHEVEPELGIAESCEPAQGRSPLSAVRGFDIRTPGDSQEGSIQRRLNE